jgi:hypothetical protein
MFRLTTHADARRLLFSVCIAILKSMDQSVRLVEPYLRPFQGALGNLRYSVEQYRDASLIRAQRDYRRMLQVDSKPVGDVAPFYTSHATRMRQNLSNERAPASYLIPSEESPNAEADARVSTETS